MLFKGRLRLPSDPGEGIPIDLELEDVILSLVSEGEDFGEWRLDKVEIRRLFSNQFALLLDGEEMVFVADDALGFAYDGLTFVEDVTGRLSKRRLFKGRKPSRRHSSTTEPESGDETEPPEPGEQERVPDVVPFFPEPAESATAPAAAASSAMTGRQMSDLVSDAPQDEEVVSMMHPIEVAPAMPAGEIVVEQFSPTPAQPASGIDEIVTEQESATSTTPAVPAPAPTPVALPEQVVEVEELEEEEAELIIEDVAAYGYAPPVSTRSAEIEATIPTPEPIQVSEPIVEQVEAPAARAPEVHPLGEEVETSLSTQADPTPASSDPAAASSEEDLADLDDDGPTIEVHVEDFDEDQIGAVAFEPTRWDEPVPTATSAETKDFAWSSNGHSPIADVSDLATNGAESNGSVEDEPEDVQQTQKSGRHARSEGRSRSGSLFSRKKSREPEAHEHRYESSKTVGGITRSICAVCDHVSFAGEDVYQGW